MKTMFEMQTWQAIVVGLVALVCVGYMSLTIARMMGRDSATPDGAREATAFESSLVGAEAPDSAKAFDGFSYRVAARFAGKVRVLVDGERVSVAGPRVPRGIYVFWILAPGPAAGARPGRVGARRGQVGLAGIGSGTRRRCCELRGPSSLGAGLWPGLGEMPYLTTGRHQAVDFPLSSVSEVKVGPGWADGGLQVVLLPYTGAIDQLATDHAVPGSRRTARVARCATRSTSSTRRMRPPSRSCSASRPLS